MHFFAVACPAPLVKISGRADFGCFGDKAPDFWVTNDTRGQLCHQFGDALAQRMGRVCQTVDTMVAGVGIVVVQVL